MMYNIYSNYSSIISLRKSAFTINELCPSICNCSYCSPFPVNSSRLISINPSLLYGLSQSCLIPSSKIVLGSNDPFCYRSRSIYDVGCCCCCCCDGEACQEGCCVKDCESNRGHFITRRMGKGDRDFRCNALGNRGDIITGRMSRGEREFRCNVLGVGGKESKGNHGDIIRGRVSRGERDFRCNALGVGIKAGRNDGVDEIRGGIIRRDPDFRCNALGGGVKEGKGNGVDGIRGRITKHERDFRCNALRNVGVRVKEKSKDHGVDRINGRIIRYERDALRVGVKESKGNVVGRIRGRTSRSERHFGCNALDEAEAMLSLLSEEGVDECVLDRERNKRSFEDSRNKGRNVVSEKCEDVKDNSNDLSGLGYSESRFKTGETESIRVRSREEGRKKREERENVKIDKEKRLRRRESSSSYYSVLDSGEFGSEIEVDVNEDGESSTSQGNDSRTTASVGLIDVTKEEKDQQVISSQRNDVRIGSSTEWDWRKKSEKKLSEESTEVSKSTKESITRQSKMSRVKGSDSTLASSSEKQFSNQEEESVSDVIYRSPLRSSIQTDDTVSEYSKSQFRTGNQFAELLISGNQSETSTSQVSSQEKLKSQTTVENQEITYLKSNQQYEKSSQESRQNVVTISSTIKRPIQGKGATVVAQSVQEAGCDYCETCGQSNQESNIEYDIQQDSELSYIHGDVKRSTSGQSQSESSMQAIVQTGSKKQGELQFTAGKLDTRKVSRQYSKTLESDYIYDQSTSSSQLHTEMQRSNLEVISASSNSSQYGKKLKEGSSGVLIKDTESRKLLQTGTKTSHVGSSSLEINRHSASGQITSKEQPHSELKLKEVKEKVGKNKPVSEIFVKTSVRTEQQGSSLQVGHTEKFSGNANASEPDASSIFQPRIQQIGEEEAKNDLQLVVMSPSYQLEQRSFLDSEPSSSFVRGTGSTGKTTEAKNDLQLVVMSPSHQLEQRSSLDSEPSSSFVRGSTGKITEVNTGSGYPQSEAGMPLSSWEADESGIGSLTESSPDDRMRSAERMHESSNQIVSEFVDKMRHESSSCRPKAEMEFSQLDKINMLTGSTQSQGDKGGFTKEDSTRLSGVSVTSVVEVSELESIESAVSRKTGKSLWNIVSGVFRFRWGSSDSQKSPVKEILKSSSNDSAASETWFSGNEHDVGAGMLQVPSSSKRSPVMSTASRTPIWVSTTPQDDNKRKEPISMAEEPTSEQSILRRKVTKSRTKKKKGSKSQESTLDKSLLRRTTGRSQKGDFIFSSLDDRLSSGEVDVSSFPSASQSGSVSGAVSTREDTDINILQQPSVSSPLGSSVSSDRQLKRSDASEEIEEAEKIEEHVGSPRDELISLTSGSISPSVAVMETGIQTSEEAVVELKQRRLQRSKQVVSDRFDEWEDAFRRENEQRKVDEIFMREALAEAIKAADSWEVPVGAVVVQNGKIIARGYNLVEELRDSTAHAEMICIREASNVLRSWRLSDTTLYVTLEPCPMCAGAILQARIKTLVWGAPNKLLGADGSWIRLFPEGAEGGERSEVAEKPAAPPHPFHPNMNIRRGVLEPECAQIMQQFFQLRRKKEKAKVKKSEEEDQPSCLPVQHSPTKLLRKMHGIFHSL